MSRESKFNFEIFHGDDGSYFAVNEDKYTIKEAIAILKEEMQCKEAPPIKPGTVFYGIGVNEYGERQNGWWLDVYETKRRNHTPVYVFEME